MLRESERAELYVLQPLQPRILLSATCLIATTEADQVDSTPAIKADDTSIVDDNSGDVKPDGIFYIRDGVKPLEDGSADDNSSDVSADPGADAAECGAVGDLGDIQPDGIMYMMGGEAELPNVLFPLNPDASDANSVPDDAGGPNVLFALNPDAGDPSAVLEDVGGPNVLFPLNPDAVDSTAETPVGEPNVFFPLNTDALASETSVAVVEDSPAPADDTQGVAVAPAVSQQTASAPEVNPLLSHKDDLLGGEKELLG